MDPLACQTLLPRTFPPRLLYPQDLKLGLAEEFDDEKQMYSKLKSLQGHSIPILYGEAEYNRQRELAISYIDGVTLAEVTHL